MISPIKLFWMSQIYIQLSNQTSWLAGELIHVVGHVPFHFSSHAHRNTPTHSRTLYQTERWHHHGHDWLSWFHGELLFPFLSLCSGIKEYKRWESPLLPTVSAYHMASACAGLRGLRLVPRLSAPHGSDNVSLKLKPQSVSMRLHAKKAIYELLDDRTNFKNDV